MDKRQFTTEDVWMANKHIKIRVTSSHIWEMQTTPRMRNSCMSTGIAKSKIAPIPPALMAAEKLDLLTFPFPRTLETSLAVF